ncbi:DNA-binding protein [Streptomyces turgidiscabies]|uniref:DNA-binding protein n=1 Tax=Streptomyces turgidiscabies TaxID=85558 RepID=UPI0038F5EB90
MIPRGRPTLDLADVAQLAGVSLATWRRRHHGAFTAAVHPLPGSERPTIYDAAQVHAHLAGEPLPPLPTAPAAEDLLTDQEAGSVAEVSASTIRADAAAGRMDRGIERHGRRWWTRAAAEARAERQSQYKGRTTGSKDKAPRVRPDHRVAEVATELAAAEAGRRIPVTAAELAELYEVSERTAERIIARARAAAPTAQTAK